MKVTIPGLTSFFLKLREAYIQVWDVGGNIRPKSVMEGSEGRPCLADAYVEVDEMVFSTIDWILAKIGIPPLEIDILVTTISLLSPAPSWTARILNRY
ncbi:unnamed protein product [Linum tenue]|uniref:FAE domain-containing protein n=1 Tax=Linum tenue TaxID=586396 RepID=A0AAV0NRV5_9ROSI|nr:unnamed protein product [Linum tenue]